MPLDPSIISNAFANAANNMPDMNALMQQRAQGAQNIYQIERQRQADAASEQEAMQAQTLQALSPAVAAAFEDPSDAGLDAAFSLVPEEFGEAADAQLAKLRSIPDVNRRKAVIRSALLQDDYGRALLAQLEPTANMRMQEGTAARRAALDERRMALEEAKLAAEGAGGGKVAFRETDAEGNVRLYDAQGIEIGMLPKAGKPAPATAGAPGDKQQARQGVDGTLSRIMDQYKILKKEKAIVSAENTAAENIGARVSTKLGTSVGRTVGTKAQSARDTIANLRQALLADIKAATGMSSKAIDSNVELKSFLDSLGDPDQSLETIQATLAELSIKYGLGSLSEDGAEATTTSESGDVDTNNPLLSDGAQ
jgi:hypothetical protein